MKFAKTIYESEAIQSILDTMSAGFNNALRSADIIPELQKGFIAADVSFDADASYVNVHLAHALWATMASAVSGESEVTCMLHSAAEYDKPHDKRMYRYSFIWKGVEYFCLMTSPERDALGITITFQ